MRTIEQIIAKNIELKLDELNMNQDELARRSKLSRQTINRIINNQVSSIRENTRLSIAKALGVSREELERNWMNAAEFVGTRPEPSDLELDNRALRDRILKLEAETILKDSQLAELEELNELTKGVSKDLIRSLQGASKGQLKSIQLILKQSKSKTKIKQSSSY